MENDRKDNNGIWGSVKNACSSAVEYLAYVKDQIKLWYHRRLAEGGRWAYSGVIVLTVLAALVVTVSLLFRYGAFCASRWVNIPDYMEGNFSPDNVLDAAGYLLFTNGGQNLFDGAHWWGFLITFGGIILVAFFTSKVTSRLERKAQRYLNGETWYRMRDHIVVFGVSDYLYSIIDQRAKVDEKDNNKRGKVGDKDKNKRAKEPKFLIVTTRDVESVRREVFSFLKLGMKKSNFVFLFGERTSEKDIAKLSLECAKEVFVIGDSEESDDIESYRDANNMECIDVICKHLKKKVLRPEKEPEDKDVTGCEVNTIHSSIVDNGVETDYKEIPAKIRTICYSRQRPLICHVMFEYQTTFATFQFCDIPSEFKDYVDFRPFNYYDLWARKVIVGCSEDEYQPLDTILDSDRKPCGYISKGSVETVHLIILGMTKMGIAMGLQAAHVCHFPNFVSNDCANPSCDEAEKCYGRKKRTRITFVDSNADIEMDYFKGRFPSMMREVRSRYMDFIDGSDFSIWSTTLGFAWHGDDKGWYDIEWEFIKGRIESDHVREYLERSAADRRHIVTVAVCLPKSHQSIAAALYLPESVFSHCLQVLAYQRRSGKILSYVKNKRNIIPFGMFDKGYDSSLDEDSRARMVSYVYDSPYSINDGSETVVSLNVKQKGHDSGSGIEEKTIKSLAVENNDCDTELLRYRGSYCIGPSNKEEKEKGILYCRYPGYDDIWRKKKVEDKLSSMFNANSIGVKLRGIHRNEKDAWMKPLTDEDVEILKRVEHNRWNIEKLLTGFRALTDKEAKELASYGKGTVAWAKMRGELKAWPLRAHLDICSCEELYRRETENTIRLDESLSRAIPAILRVEKEIKEEQKQKSK